MVLKIAMVSPYFVRCGIATYTKQLNDALAQSNCEVYGIRLPRFGRKTASTMNRVVNMIPKDDIDLIHVQHEYGLFQSLDNVFFDNLQLLDKPIITTMHAVGNYEVDPLVESVSDQIIVHNQYCAKRIVTRTKIKIRIIHHGCTPLTSPPPPEEACKESMGINPKAQLVGYLGFITPVKGLDILIEAMIKVRKAALLIGGGWHVEGETEFTLHLKQQSLKLLPNRCRWLGYVSDEDLSRVYGASKVFCYPSRWVTESGALLQAISHGKAVIATSLPPNKEKENAGALQTFKNIQDLTRKIKRLLKNDALRHKLEDGAKTYALNNSWNKVAKEHVDVYKQVL